MSRYKVKPEVSVKSDTSVAKLAMKSVGYGKESSVAKEGGEES
jgi:hypothetical protein